MADSVADDPKLAPLWDVGQNPQPVNKLEARSFRTDCIEPPPVEA